MPPSYPQHEPVLSGLAMSATREASPSIQTITEKEDLRNQLATAGGATEVINLFSSNTEKGISFVLN